jgi:hypothetical protein
MNYEKAMQKQNEDEYSPSEEESERYWKTRKSDLRVDKVCANCESKFLDTQCKGAENCSPCDLWVFTQLQTEDDPAQYEREDEYIKRHIAYGYR